MPDIDGRIVLGAIVALAGAVFWAGRMTEFKSNTSKMLQEIRDDVKKIFDRLAPTSVTSGSPLRLTELGQKISRELNAQSWAQRVSEDVSGLATGKEPFEVHEISANFVSSYQFDDKRDAAIRKCAYENGLERKQVLDVLMVVLRDVLLERNLQ